MKHLPVVRIFLLAVLLFLVGCNDSASGSAEEKKTTLYTSVVLGACSEVPTSGSLQADGLKCAGEWCIRSDKDSYSAVYIGDCRGCYKLSLSAFDYCEISADVALDVADDPCLFRMSMCRKLPNVPAIPITNFWFRPWMVIDMSNLMMKFFGLKRQTK